MSSSEKQTNLNKLLEEVKGTGCEIKTLGEVVEKFVRGTPEISKSRENDGNFPAIVCGDIFSSNFYIDECEYFVDETTLKNLPIVENGDLIMAWKGYTNKNKKGFCLFTGNYKALVGNNTYILKHSRDPKYFSLALDTKNVEQQMELFFKTGFSSVLFLLLPDIRKLKIPLPSLDLQTKIGDFLFSFIEYEKQLKREQKARRKQFHYFKEQIFSDLVEKCRLRNVGWEIKSIGDFATEVNGGNDITKKHLGTGSFPVITNLDLFNSQLFIKECVNFVDEKLIDNKKYVDEGDLIISDRSNARERVGKATVYLGKERCLVERRTLTIKHNQNPKYLTYFLSTNSSRKQIEILMTIGIFSGISPKNIKKIQIPLPSLEKQERIVEILDKFYDLCENPDKGLNKLIKLNKKQYEYYRNLIFDHLKI